MRKLIKSHVLELIYNSYDLNYFAEDLNYKGEPFKWDIRRRELLQTDLDAIYAHLYRLSKKDLKYILESYILLKENEMKEFNEYRTKRLVLEAYDKFSKQKELFE